MKFVRRISILFVYPTAMFLLGYITGSAAQDYFYPGEQCQEGNDIQSEKTQTEAVVETAYAAEQVITADTSYVVISYDLPTGIAEEKEEVTPDCYIGYNREKLEEALRAYDKSPSLTDLVKGFLGIELLSFSEDKVIIKKTVTKISHRPLIIFTSIDFRYEKIFIGNESPFQLVETVKFFAVGCS